MTENEILEPLLKEVRAALVKVLEKHKKHPSIEHSFTVILEELEELKAEIFWSEPDRVYGRVRAEAMDIAVAALRSIIDYDIRHMEKRNGYSKICE